MFKVLMIGFGGFLGSIMRHLSGTYVNSVSKTLHFPSGTFFVNMVGCFLMGALSQFVSIRHFFSPEVESLILIGFLGSFTTYSTFSNDSFKLIKNGKFSIMILNIISHILVGLLAVFAGLSFINYIFI